MLLTVWSKKCLYFYSSSLLLLSIGLYCMHQFTRHVIVMILVVTVFALVTVGTVWSEMGFNVSVCVGQLLSSYIHSISITANDDLRSSPAKCSQLLQAEQLLKAVGRCIVVVACFQAPAITGSHDMITLPCLHCTLCNVCVFVGLMERCTNTQMLSVSFQSSCCLGCSYCAVRGKFASVSLFFFSFF